MLAYRLLPLQTTLPPQCLTRSSPSLHHISQSSCVPCPADNVGLPVCPDGEGGDFSLAFTPTEVVASTPLPGFSVPVRPTPDDEPLTVLPEPIVSSNISLTFPPHGVATSASLPGLFVLVFSYDLSSR